MINPELLIDWLLWFPNIGLPWFVWLDRKIKTLGQYIVINLFIFFNKIGIKFSFKKIEWHCIVISTLYNIFFFFWFNAYAVGSCPVDTIIIYSFCPYSHTSESQCTGVC